MTLKGKIGVEPLDEERLTNIERRIVAGAADRLAQRGSGVRHGFAWATAVAAAIAAGVTGWQLHREPEPTPAVAQKMSIATDERASRLALEGATLGSSPGAVFEVTRSDGRVEIVLTKGKLELAVEHRPERVLIVRAGDTEVEDVGTRFSVDYDGASRATVVVTEGQVKVTRQRKAQVVAAGSAWTPSEGVVAIPDVEPTAPQVAAIAQDPPSAGLREHRAAVPQVEPPVAPAKRPTPVVTAPPRPRPVVARAARDDLRSRIASHPPELAVDLPLAEYPLRAANENDLDRHAILLFSWAVKAYDGAGRDPKLYDLADHVLDGLVAKRAGTKYVDALWLRLRIRCRRGFDDRCRDTARDYVAANGPLNDLAQEILSSGL